MKDLVWRIQAALFYLFTCVMATIPNEQRFKIGAIIGKIMYHFLAARRRIAIDNIEKALPFMRRYPGYGGGSLTAEEIARQNFINMGISLIETCHLYHGNAASIINSVDVVGIEHYHEAKSKGNGLICLTGHCGNWELGALGFSIITGDAMSVLARRQNNPYLNSIVEKMRIRYNNRVIYKDGALRPMLSLIKKNGIVGMLTDQAVSPDEGVLISVMGRKGWGSKATVIIARKTGAPVLPIFIHRDGERQILTFSKAFELSDDLGESSVQRDVQLLSDHLQDFVCHHPSEWYWVHRRWKRAGEPTDE